MAYNKLKIKECEKVDRNLGLKSAAIRFIHHRCEDLRFDEEKENIEQQEGKNLGKSLKAGQIPYNMEMDIDRLCLENALKRFLDSGADEDAFDVYFCYLEMFVGNYGSSRRMIELLSEFETNGSSLLMKHRDHYSHSVYVFALGLAIYETNSIYRETYKKYYGFPAEGEEQKAAHHFLEFWGLSSLFHDIGYPFELPFEQVESYFEVKGEKRKNNPFVAYIGMENFVKIQPDAQEKLKEMYGEKFANTNQLFAYDIANKLGETYHLTKESMEVILATKPTNPNRFGYFMDHGYFSASVLFQELYEVDRKEQKEGMTKERIDALSAIILHNSLYKFSVAFYKNKNINKPLNMELHPLAYMLMICDELQCWDRTSYGRNSRTELHPMDCQFTFQENNIVAKYIFDKEEQYKIDAYEKAYRQWLNNGKEKKDEPKLKAYASMVHENEFLKDIEKIVNTEALQLTVKVDTEKAVHEGKKVFLSNSNFIHLYNFAVALNARYSHLEEEECQKVLKIMEEEFDGLSLEYKLSNVGQAKAFAEYLNAIGCFYTDRPVALEMVKEFGSEDIKIIGPLEHERWLRERQEMGWTFADDYKTKEEREQRRVHKSMLENEITITAESAAEHYKKLSEEEQDKDTEPMNAMLQLIKYYDGLRIYRL